MTNNEQNDPLSPLTVGAIAFHESFLALRTAGFERKDALYLLAATIVAREDG